MAYSQISDEPLVASLLKSLLKRRKTVYYQRGTNVSSSIHKIEAFYLDEPSRPSEEPYYVMTWEGAHGEEMEWFNYRDLDEMTLEKSTNPRFPGFIFRRA